MEFPKRGTRVKVTIEGVVGYSLGNTMYVGESVEITDSDRATTITVEIIRPEIKVGQVWNTSHGHWFVRGSTPLRLIAASYDVNGPLFGNEFFDRYPDAELVFDPS